MKSASLPRNKSKRLYFLSCFSLASLLFSLTFVWQTGHAQQSLTLADILIGLRSKKATLDERNKLLTDAVKVRGITFALTPEIEKELETTGASKELVDTIRQKSAALKIAFTPTPAPVIVATPAPALPDFSFYQKQADAFMVKGEYDRAVVSYNKVIELNPKNASSYLSRGLSYQNKQSYNSAISDYDKAIELSPNESIAYFNRGYTYEKLGNREKAIADYQKATALDATNENIKAALKRLQDEQAKEEQAKAEQPKTFTQTRPQPEAAAVKVPAKVIETAKPVETPKNPAQLQTMNLGQLTSDRAIKMVMPIYSPEAIKFNLKGQVIVQVSLDEEGNVTSAKATLGAGMLRVASEEAARRSKFKPAIVDGKPAKATGFITYNFKAN